MRFVSLALLLALAACEHSQIRVRAAIPGPDGTLEPASGLALVALPYDRDSVLAAFEAAAPTPRPHPGALDSLVDQFREPFVSYTRLALAAERWRDTLDLLRLRLDSLPRGAEAYRTLYAQFVTRADSLAALQRSAEAARRRLDVVRRDVVPRIDSLRREVAQWEDSTFRAYDDTVRALQRRIGRPVVSDTTGPDGTTLVVLPRGPWWIYARSWDVNDPYAYWYWNVRVQGDTVALTPANAEHRPRY